MLGTRIFRGMVPRLSDRLLAGENAQLARDCWLDRGHPTPVPALERVPGVGIFGASVKTIFRYDGTEANGDMRFLAFNDDVDVVRSPVINDTLTRVIWSGDVRAGETADNAKVKHTSTRILQQGGGFSSGSRPSFRHLGVPAPDTAPTVALGDFTEEDDNLVAENQTWVYTWVTDMNEEGPPSSPSAVVTRGFNTDGSLRPATVTLPATAPANTGVTHARLYRSAGTDFLRVGQDIAVTTNVSVTDNNLTSSLGEVLITDNWDPPPDGLQGVTVLHNGILAGFKGRDIYFSVPYQPHAWPTDYIITVDSDIVGIGGYGVNIVVGTKGRPHIISGDDPSVAAAQQLELDQSCASKKSIAWIDRQGIVYASNEGLILVGPGGAQFVSTQWYDRDDWQKLGPETMTGAYHDGMYIAFSDGKATAFSESEAPVEIIDAGIRTVYQDRDQDKLYVIMADRYLAEWKTTEEGATMRTMTWRSKLHVAPGQAFSAAQVFCDEEAVFRLYAAGSASAIDYDSPVFQKVVGATEINRPFRLPVTMGIHTHWVYEVVSQGAVYEVRIGSMRDMAG